jgi:hypothetical protein
VVIKLLHQAYLRGTPVLGADALLSAIARALTASAKPSRNVMAPVFKAAPAVTRPVSHFFLTTPPLASGSSRRSKSDASAGSAQNNLTD